MTDDADIILVTEDAPFDKPGVRLLTLNRPERRNALSPDLVVALTEALWAADKDKDVRAVVITGAGEKAFCAGGDLGSVAGEGFLGMHDARHGFVDLLRAFRDIGTPTVCAAQGHALGGGFGILLSCDLAVAAEEATFGTPEVKRGLFPMMIAPLVYEAMPRRVAHGLVLLGDRLTGAQCADLSVVNRAVPQADVLETALELAMKLAALSPSVLSLGRKAVYRQFDMPFHTAVDHMHGQLTLNLQTEDAAEGVMAFMQKREPSWTGR